MAIPVAMAAAAMKLTGHVKDISDALFRLSGGNKGTAGVEQIAMEIRSFPAKELMQELVKSIDAHTRAMHDIATAIRNHD